MNNSLFRKKHLHALLDRSVQLERTLNGFDLVLLGVGAIIGTGIFILPGTVAANHSGPAIIFSFMIASVVCALAGMCYSEFSSSIPVTGGAYTYGYIVFGEMFAWLIGWILILEYGLAVASVATGWSAYLTSLLEGFHVTIPKGISGPFDPANGTYINLPAIIVVLALGLFLMRGLKESTTLNKIMVFVKVGVILLFIGVGIFYVQPNHWQPFMPFGIEGVMSGAAVVFFAFLGFDAVASAAEETINPQRNLPIGIIGSLIVCTALYVTVSLVMTGMVSYTFLNVADPVGYVMQLINLNWVAGFISLGAVLGMTTVILVMLYAGTRLLFALGRDGLLPNFFCELHPSFKTPVKNTWILAAVIAFCAGFIPLADLAELVNMGTLIAFSIVSIGILFLRKNSQIPSRGFQVPFFPLLPILSFLLCFFLMTQLSFDTWIACAIWILIGAAIYLSYGRKNSTMNEQS